MMVSGLCLISAANILAMNIVNWLRIKLQTMHAFYIIAYKCVRIQEDKIFNMNYLKFTEPKIIFCMIIF